MKKKENVKTIYGVENEPFTFYMTSAEAALEPIFNSIQDQFRAEVSRN